MATYDRRLQAVAAGQSHQLYCRTCGAEDRGWKPCGPGLGRVSSFESRAMSMVISNITDKRNLSARGVRGVHVPRFGLNDTLDLCTKARWRYSKLL